VPAPSYERYGLTGNPFRDLSSESLSDVELFHVNLDLDRALEALREEVFSKENRAVVALVGLHGSGKTERLLLTASEARARKAFVVYYDMTAKTTWAMRGLAEAVVKSANLGGFAQLFSAPKWFREISALTKLKDKAYDHVRCGRALAQALNANAPAVLLLNDLHNVTAAKELAVFTKALQELIDGIKPGVLVMFGAFPSFMLQLAREQPPLMGRVNRTIVLPRFNQDEAALMVAKKLLAKRLVEGLDPLYPFDRDAIAKLNETAYGNPRRVLELADAALEYAATHRAYRIDVDVLRSAFVERKVKEIDRVMDKSFEWSEDTLLDDPARSGTRMAASTSRGGIARAIAEEDAPTPPPSAPSEAASARLTSATDP
jgi:type II secretory pathway predicted ATPase ExeA